MSKLIIFDFDGTMVDSLSYYLSEAKKYFPSYHHVLNQKYIHNHGMKSLLNELPIPKIFIPFLLVYLRYRHHHIIKKLKPHEGYKELLKKLSKDYKIGIVSSNSTKTINVFLKLNNLDQYISFVDSSPFYFGKAKNLKKWKQRYNKNTYYFYIGDEQRDIEAANSVEMISIAVNWGTESEKLLLESEPIHLVKNTNEIYKIISEY